MAPTQLLSAAFCAIASAATAVAVPPAAPAPPSPPPPPPPPSQLMEVLSMCIVVTGTTQYPDWQSIHTYLMAALLAKPYPCFIQLTSTNGCDLPNERNQTSRVCTTNEWGGEACDPDDLVRIIPGSAELVASRSDDSNSKRLIASAGNAVYSVTVVGFSHQAPGDSSFAERLCDAFVAGFIGFQSPLSLAAMQVLDPDWRVHAPPWSGEDIAWLLLWLSPVWLPALLLPAVAARRAFRRTAVLLELESALSEIEVEQMRSRFHEKEVRKAVCVTKWMARALLLLAIGLVPWLPAFALLPAALPLARRKISCAAWITSRPSRKFWLTFTSAAGFSFFAWLLASWSLLGVGSDRELYRVGHYRDPRPLFVSACRQLFSASDDDGYESIDGWYFPYRGKVCSVLMHAIEPQNVQYLGLTLLAQGCVSLLVAILSLALLRKAAGSKAYPGWTRLSSSSSWCDASVDELLTVTAERLSDRFAGAAKELVVGQPEEAATGLYGIIGYSEAYLHDRMRQGTAAIIEEAEALGDPEVLENLRFQNGWRRDCWPDGSSLGGREGMVLADFVALPVARRARLEEAHVVALRLYSTAAFRALNGPMRQLKVSNYRKGEDGLPLPLEPPQLAAPHPQPATMAFIYEALKRMRAVAAVTTAGLDGMELEELVESGELSLDTLRRARVSGDGRLGETAVEESPVPVSDSGEAERAAANCEERAKPCDAGEPAARGGGTALLAAFRALCSSKAAKPAKAGEGRILWRGMGDMRASSRFLAMGGTEFACCSTTSRLEVAARYASAAGKQRALLFRLKSSTFMNMGVDISEFSAFPHEKEYLYPPLTYMHPSGVTHRLVRNGVTFDVVEVEPSFPS
ncbi:hypothetical protein EMIHUDRAFT_114014 [Emiliania huxleyi CCMP1516]|uniref:Mono(ADP-ribosyl)transferase n=2 Tax=Emiliania huxleyi TaxID=2903 RepID=A0A0D3JZ91_EMIH1|nr:hypothetical protein EMIHUDRAFT_114014 [Emiliania huxleyi CCMP1516]EOD28826.1 hypothetical protein EMIHUDRAFT_114014 [Emiliania huxleyi CCMP1516]|eukprot:XP_005781255.1 hypothetical protein EMIHUDRAFT_114014 [Emiliania huxleyi CCMP1516]